MLISEGARPRVVMERLGHSSIAVTMDTYGHRFPPEDRATIDVLEKAFRDASSNISRPVDGLQFIGSPAQPMPKRRESPPKQGFSGVGLRGFEPPTFGPPDRIGPVSASTQRQRNVKNSAHKLAKPALDSCGRPPSYLDVCRHHPGTFRARLRSLDRRRRIGSQSAPNRSDCAPASARLTVGPPMSSVISAMRRQREVVTDAALWRGETFGKGFPNRIS